MTAHAPGCLAGLRVIDASRVLAGPYCAQMLGDHGADVVKIEAPEGDETRAFGPAVGPGGAAYFQAMNRNKRGLVLDMGLPAARALFWELVAGADVLIENYKPSTLRAWGVADARDICRRHPRLVHCRITGFGDDGPWGGLPGYDAAVQAAAGLMSANGEAGGPPLRLGIPVVDLATGMQAATAVLAALMERHASGRGQMCDVALYDCALAIAHPHLANHLWSGDEPARLGNGHPNVVPYDAFDTADGRIYIAVGNDRQFALLCVELGLPALADDARFRTNPQRIAHRTDLMSLLVPALAAADGQALAERLQRRGVPAAPVLGIGQAARAPHTAHRQMVLQQEGYRAAGFAAKLSRTPAALRHTPPLPGEHQAELLREAGLDPERIAALTAAGVFGRPGRSTPGRPTPPTGDTA